MSTLRAGLLPMYIKLYDDAMPQMRPRIEDFLHDAVSELEKNGLKIITAPVCRIENEFQAAVKALEEEKVDALITLHLAYSPSLESIGPISSTVLPLIIFDTTSAYDFSALQEPEEISFNHGIHGVQDLCNMLIRSEKEFFIEAGHLYRSDAAARVAARVRACRMATEIRNARVGIVGKPFKGMGDFYLPEDVLQSTLGLKIIPYDMENSEEYRNKVSVEAVDAEMSKDREQFNLKLKNTENHFQSTVAGLMLRDWIQREKLTAFTVNFMDITKASGIPRMPFIEASKAMARGIGYAGEGDVLTAALVGTLLSVYTDVSFAEMFCPNWRDNTIYISHMGEMNISLADGKPIVAEIDYPYTDADNPVVAYGRFKQGEMVYVNLAPGRNNTYTLIISKVRMIDVQGVDKMVNTAHGWFEPGIPVAEFLEKFSKAGGTHHGAIVYGDVLKDLEMLGALMNWNVIVI